MKHTFKICAALLLALVLVLSVSLMISCGEDNDDTLSIGGVASDRGDVDVSGTCADGLKWTLYKNGELVFTGTCENGVMFDYNTASETPAWKAYASKITGLTLNNSIKTISADAFSSLKNLIWVDFGTGVETISTNAFRSCSNLRRVILPESVKTIGNNAFDGCYRMYEARMTDNVTQIGNYAFAGCTNLVSVTFPKSVQVGDNAFADDYKLLEVITSNTYVAAESEDFGGVALYASKSGGVHAPDKEAIITREGDFLLNGQRVVGYLGNETVIDTFPANANQIYDYAFYANTRIETVVLDGKIAAIGEKAFANCTGIKTLTIGANVRNIYDGAFSGCSNVETLNYNAKAYASTNKTTDIFAGFTSLTTVTFASDVAALPTGGGLFRGCTALKTVTMPAIATIPDGMLDGCTALETVVFNAKNKTIGEAAFRNCSSLENPNFTTMASGSTIGAYAFEGCSSILKVDLSKVGRVKVGAFNYCKSLTSVVIGTSFGFDTGKTSFDGCIKLIDVVNNCATVEIVPGDATNNAGISRYTQFAIGTGESRLKEKDGFLFFETADVNYLVGYVGTETALVLPANYNGTGYAIYERAFSNNNKIVSVKIGAGVTVIGEDAFRSCTQLVSVDFTGATIVVIPAYAFDGCTALETLTLSDSITTIEECAFRDCKKLGAVNLKNVSTLGLRAFQYSGITELTAGNNLTVIPNDAFSGCARLARVSIPGAVTIGNQAFANCVTLKQINMPKAETIGEYAFYRNIELAKVELTATTIVGQGAFQECGGMTSLTLGTKMTTICESAFKDCGKLVYILNLSEMELNVGEMGPGYVTRNAEIVAKTATDTLKTEGDYSYIVVGNRTYLVAYNGTATEITLPATLGGKAYDIYRFAFWGTPVKRITVSEGVQVIGVSAFAYSAVEHVSLPASLVELHDSAFEGSALRTIEIKNGLSTLGDACFKYCRELISVTMPDSVTKIGASIFRDCVSLREVTLSKNLAAMPRFAFDGCVTLKQIVIRNPRITFPKTDSGAIATNNGRWFWGCNGLLEIWFPGGSGLGSSQTLNNREEKISITTDTVYSKMFTDDNGFMFYSYNGTNFLVGYVGTEKDLVLPETCKNQSYQIYDYAFYNRDDIETVRFSDGVTGIGAYAFAECDNLKGVYIPTTVNSKFGVRENVFWGCNHKLVVATGFASADALPETWDADFNVQGPASVYGLVYGVTYDYFATMLK